MRQTRRRLMVLAAPRGLEGEGEDHVGPERPHDPHHVAQGLLAPPPLERLLHAEREAEVRGPAEVLLHAVVAVDGEELLGAQHGEGVEELGADVVLSAVAPGQGQERGADPQTAGEADEDAVVLVVGVGRHVQDASPDREAAQGEAETGRPALVGEGRDLRARRSGEGPESGGDEGNHDPGRAAGHQGPPASDSSVPIIH